MPTLHRSKYLLVQHQHASGFVRIVRSETPFESVEGVVEALDECSIALERLDLAHHGVLFDWRKSPISTDPNLHRTLAEHMDALGERFARRAILLATTVGTMQAARVGRTMGNRKMLVFDDEAAALEYVRYP